MKRIDGKPFITDLLEDTPEVKEDTPGKQIVEVKKGLWLLISPEKCAKTAKEKMLAYLERAKINIVRFG